MFDFLFSDDINDKKAKDTSKNTKANKHNVEFSEDIASNNTSANIFSAPVSTYSNNGVQINEVNSAIEIQYNGLLASNDKNQLIAVVGYGNNLSWEDVEQYPLTKRSFNNSFNAVIPVRRSGNINIAFKDDAGNWDNNSGLNYTFNNYFYKGNH